MKIVLAGSSGGIGSAVLDLLVKENVEVIELNSSDIDFKKKFDYSLEDVDGLIYCAGINKIAEYKNIEEKDLEDTINVNTFSFIRLCQKIKFSGGANIIAIGSLYSTETKVGRLAYTLSKHALFGSVKTLALEMASNKIKVNLVSPGFVNTALTKKNNTPERIQFLEKNIPLGLTSSEEIAKICLYLLKDNQAITGQNIIVDGGYSLIGV